MRMLIHGLLAVLAAGALAACSPGGTGTAPTSPGTTASPGGTETTAPDAETTESAPSPPAGPSLGPGPGQGDAELSIMVKPSESEAALSYTLVCQGGEPAAESQHPSAAEACLALKENPSLLSPPAPGTERACTQQYGGPQTATVTGMVDGTAVEASFALRDGCEIAAWKAAENILGAPGGAL
jgi:hypothetical protein